MFANKFYRKGDQTIMYTKYIDTQAEIPKNISDSLEQITFNSIRKVLPDSAIIDACKSAGYSYRQRTITPIVTVLHMLLAAIWPQESFAASWQVLWAAFSSRSQEAAGHCPSLGSVAKARARVPLAAWKNIFQWLCEHVQHLSSQFDTWRGHRVVLLDGTCVSMPDVPELSDEFGTCSGAHGRSRYPLARLVTLCIANTMTIIDYAMGRYDNGETSLAMPLLRHLKKGDILIADRHFAAAHYYVHYLSVGLEFLTRAHQNLHISRIRRMYSYSADDFVGWLYTNPVYRRRDPELPEKVKVRFIRATVCIRGRYKAAWFVSSLLDDSLYPAEEIVQLYARRWRIETLLRTVKIDLSADVLRSMSAEGIRKELAARLIGVNIIRAIMIEAAMQTGTQPVRISFAYAVRAIIMFAPALATEPLWRLPHIYKAMLTEIGSHVVPERPGRNEPRAVRRECKHYPALKTTRAQWRAAYAA
jgi:hypothetical protein